MFVRLRIVNYPDLDSAPRAELERRSAPFLLNAADISTIEPYGLVRGDDGAVLPPPDRLRVKMRHDYIEYYAIGTLDEIEAAIREAVK